MFDITLTAAPKDRMVAAQLAAALDTFDNLIAWRTVRGRTAPSLSVYLFSDIETLREIMSQRMRTGSDTFELFVNIGEPLVRRPPQLLVCQTRPKRLRQTLETIASVCFFSTFSNGVLQFPVSTIRAIFDSDGWLEARRYDGSAFFSAAPADLSRFDADRRIEPTRAFCAVVHPEGSNRFEDYSRAIMTFGSLVGKACNPHFAFTFRKSGDYVDTLTIFPGSSSPETFAPQPIYQNFFA